MLAYEFALIMTPESRIEGTISIKAIGYRRILRPWWWNGIIVVRNVMVGLIIAVFPRGLCSTSIVLLLVHVDGSGHICSTRVRVYFDGIGLTGRHCIGRVLSTPRREIIEIDEMCPAELRIITVHSGKSEVRFLRHQ